MLQTEICPKCHADFPTREGLLSGGIRFGNNAFSRKGLAVRCPNCWNEFPAQNLRLFGVLPSDSLRWVVVAILVVCVVVACATRQGH